MDVTFSASDAEVNVLSHKIDKLDNELKKREMHLAELIDEVLYAEGSKAKAVHRAEVARHLVGQLEGMLQDMLGYMKLIESDVLLPAFLDLSNVGMQEPVTNRVMIKKALENIVDCSLTTRTKRLITAVKDLPSEMKNRAARETFLRNLTEESVNVEDTIVLSGLFLKKKEELGALLDDLRERLHVFLHGTNIDFLTDRGRSRSTGVNWMSASDHGCPQGQQRSLENNGDRLQPTTLRDRGTVDGGRELEEEVSRMAQQLQDAHNAFLQERSKSHGLEMHVKTLEQNIGRLEHEKRLLQQEIDELRPNGSSKRPLHVEQQHGGEDVRLLQAELNQVNYENRARCAAIESQLAETRAQNAILLAEKQDYVNQLDKRSNQIASLQMSNEELQREVFELQQRLLSSFSSAAEQDSTEKISKLEAKIASLTQDLGALERQMAKVVAHNNEERNWIIAQYEEERKRHMAERKECDMVIERMANDLERLSVENRSLRNAATLQKL